MARLQATTFESDAMNTLLSGPARPITVPQEDLDLARTSSASLLRLLERGADPLTLRFSDPRNGTESETIVPGAAVRVLAEALAQMAEGHPVTVVPLAAELSTQQAADLMGVSRPYLIKLLESGQIPFRKVGEHRRVRQEDLQNYQAAYRLKALEAAREMTAEAQALGLYDD